MTLPPPQLDETWKEALKDEWEKSYLKELAAFVGQERGGDLPIYPSQQEVFAAFNATPFDKVKVVIVGQDPYHGPGQAHGLSFSVKPGLPLPPSLKNIYKELESDLGIPPVSTGHLTRWAEQGVMMLNNVLTVRHKQPHSHAKRGWERFTDEVVARLCARKEPVIFVLWGKAAQEKCAHVPEHHFVLTSPHPSPYSAHSGFFGCRHFSKINDLLTRLGKSPIDWRIEADGN